MKLYFLRHGLAEERGEWKGDDFDRPLTAEGKERTSQAAAALASLGLKVDAIITSPLLRARQTAEIVAAGLQIADRLAADKRLEPGFDAAQLGEILKSHADAEALVLVGHEPDFSSTIGELTGGNVVVKKGGLALIDLPDPSRLKGDLLWLVPPRLLERGRGLRN